MMMMQQQPSSAYGTHVGSFDPFSALASPSASYQSSHQSAATPNFGALSSATSNFQTPQAAWAIQMTNAMHQMQIPAAMHQQLLNQLSTVPPQMHGQYLQQIQRQIMSQQQQSASQAYGFGSQPAQQQQQTSFFQQTQPQSQPQSQPQFSSFSSASTPQRTNANTMSDFPF
jgi:hypothetical protein